MLVYIGLLYMEDGYGKLGVVGHLGLPKGRWPEEEKICWCHYCVSFWMYVWNNCYESKF